MSVATCQWLSYPILNNTLFQVINGVSPTNKLQVKNSLSLSLLFPPSLYFIPGLRQEEEISSQGRKEGDAHSLFVDKLGRSLPPSLPFRVVANICNFRCGAGSYIPRTSFLPSPKMGWDGMGWDVGLASGVKWKEGTSSCIVSNRRERGVGRERSSVCSYYSYYPSFYPVRSSCNVDIY